MKIDKGFTPACDAQCKKLQKGLCKRLTVDEIEILLDNTDWDDLDKGDIMTPYIMQRLSTENKLIQECNHSDISVEKYPIGSGYYGQCKDCPLTGNYANTKEEAEYKFKKLIKEKQP